MKRIIWKSNISILVLIMTMIVGIFGDVATQTSFAEAGESESIIYAAPTEVYVLTVQDIVEKFNTSESFVQQQLDQGYSLDEIYNIFFQAKEQQLSYEESRLMLYPTEINSSSSVSSDVYSELIDPLFRNVPIVDANTVTNLVYSEKPELTVESSIPTDKDEDASTVTEDVYTKKTSMLRSMTAETNPIIEKAPVYSKTSFNEAPYSVGNSNDSISSLSGGLSMHSDDLSLPGRNGLSFTLTRQYDTKSSQFYDMDYGYSSFIYDYYRWAVTYNAIKKDVTNIYDVSMRENVRTEYDYNSDGQTDSVSNSIEQPVRVVGSYDTESAAREVVNQIPKWSYNVPADSIIMTGSDSNKTNNFNSYIMYNQNGYTGPLYKTGVSFQSGGEYTASVSKPSTISCTNKIGGLYTKGIWTQTNSGTPCQDPYQYSDSDDFKGSLYRTKTDAGKECPSPTSTTTNGVCTKEFIATFSGTITKAASDTREYTQKYNGFVNKPSFTSNERYEAWVYSGNGRTRKIYSRFGAAWYLPRSVENGTVTTVQLLGTFDEYSEAVDFKNAANSAAGMFLGSDTENGVTVANYYMAPSPGADTYTYKAGTTNGVEYYNLASKPMEEKMYPIGKGWSWKLPYVEVNEGKLRVHLAEGGSYDVENSSLKGYEWQGVTFTTNTSVTVNEEHSQYVLTSTDGTQKQYFTSDGRLLQISDAYNNSIQFQYENNAVYGSKLLSQVKDAIGNTIQLTYTDSDVTLKKGSQTVVYKKHTEEGVELLDSVTDVIGRKTTYSYQIKDAQFNLLSNYGERAKTNPYALLTKTQHPTGAITEYTYEAQPIKRYIGVTSYDEEYRLSSRKDLISYENGESKVYNQQSIYYNNSDAGSSYNQDMQFSTTLNDGLTNTTYNYKKDYIDDQTPSQFYLESSVQSADSLDKLTNYTYGKYVGTKAYPASVPTKVTTNTNKTSDVLTSSSTYDDYGNIIESTDMKGRITSNTYDDRHLLKSTLEPVNVGASRYIEYSRNEQGSISQIVARKDNASGEMLQKVNFNNYDNFGNAKTQSVLNGAKTITTTTEYDSSNNAFPISQQLNITDSDNQVSQISVGAEYDSFTGLITASVDDNKHRTGYQYDGLGRITAVIHPDKSNLSAIYDDLNNTITVTDEEGMVARTQWNALGLKIESGIFEADVYKKKSSSGFDGFGRLIWNQDALGHKTQHEYDLWSRPVKTIYTDMSESTMKYDDTLQSISSVDAEGYTRTETFNKWGQAEKIEEKNLPGSSVDLLERFVYNNINDQVAEHFDGNGNKTSYTYDYSGNLVSVTDPKGEMTKYGYDMLGNIISTINPAGGVKSKTFNELGWILTTTDEAGLSEKYKYDGAGNLLTSADRNGSSTTYTYDNMNQLEQRTSPDESVSYVYDHTGKRTSMTDSTGTTSYHYDKSTGFLTKVDYADGLNLKIPEYDSNGNRKSMVGPFGETTTYTYDGMNRLETIGTDEGAPVADYDYYKNGLQKQTTAKNGIINTYKYTGLNLFELDVVNSDVLLNHYQYSYDSNKNIKGRTQNDRTDTFSYDELNRVALSTENGSETYEYDNRGNRSNHYSSVDGDTFKDANYTYDKQNRLTKAQTDGKTVEYGYNGDGLLINRTENGVITRYYYDGDQIIAEATVVNGVPQLLASYIRGQKLEAIDYKDGTRAYPSYNGHGDIVELRNEQGVLLNHYDYDIWGNITSKQEQVHNPFRYAGELWDDTTNLQYLRARWYDPSVGRFINEDTYEGQIDNPLSLNLYTYVENNPIRYFDPTGNTKYQIGGLSQKPKYRFDSDFNYDPNTKATVGDRANWVKWGIYQKGAYLIIGKDGAKAYGHYRGGSGTTMNINYERAYKEDSVIKQHIDSEITFAQKSAEGFYGKGSGTSFEMISNLIGIPNGDSENWQKTIGAHYVYAHSQVSIDSDVITMIITFYMEDMYNFNNGMADIASGTLDAVNGRFAELGWAQEFLTMGSMTRTVTWTIGHIGTTQIVGGDGGR